MGIRFEKFTSDCRKVTSRYDNIMYFLQPAERAAINKVWKLLVAPGDRRWVAGLIHDRTKLCFRSKQQAGLRGSTNCLFCGFREGYSSAGKTERAWSCPLNSVQYRAEYTIDLCIFCWFWDEKPRCVTNNQSYIYIYIYTHLLTYLLHWAESFLRS